MAEGIGIELEEFGLVALIGFMIVPGIMWIAKGKSTGSMIGRTVLVGGLIAAAMAIETSLDKSVEDLVN